MNQPPMSHLDRLLSPIRLNGLVLRNRVIKAATFEGMTPLGVPSGRLIEFHRSMAQGGVALTTVAYCAPQADGRLHGNQMHIRESICAELKQLADQVHQFGGAISAQLVHCGSFTKNTHFEGTRPLGPSPGLNLYGIPYGVPFAGAMSIKDIDATVAAFGQSAMLLKAVGFDAFELHLGHGYLLSQFISPKTNRRADAYGGSIAHRLRFAFRVIDEVRDCVGTNFPLIAKLGMTDGVKGGHNIDDAIECAKLLESHGGLDAIALSGGTSSMNPMIMFRGRSLMPGLIAQEKNAVARLGMQMLKGVISKDYPYHELYFLESAKRVRDAVKMPLAYIGGAAEVASLETVMAEGFDFVQLGRTLIKDPNLVRHLTEQRAAYVNGCSHCNQCATLIDHPDGIRCVENDVPNSVEREERSVG